VYGIEDGVLPDDAEIGVLLPAKLAKGRSSAVAEDRTATDALSPSSR